jgi:hypothetical protein
MINQRCDSIFWLWLLVTWSHQSLGTLFLAYDMNLLDDFFKYPDALETLT